MAWIAMGRIFFAGGAVAWKGVKGLANPPPGEERKTSKGTAYASLVMGVPIMAAGIVVPRLVF